MIGLAADDMFNEAMAKLAAGDLQNARRRMKAAADANYPPAVSLYALFVEHGIGGRASEHKAMLWYTRAARLGDTSAEVRLARWHLANHRIPQAKYWLRQTRDPRARLVLAGLYEASRSTRANALAKLALSFATGCSELNVEERAELERLRTEYRSRTSNPMWSRLNQHIISRQWMLSSSLGKTAPFDADVLRTWLINKGIALGPPATASAINGLRKAMWGAVHPHAIAMYKAFDGSGAISFGQDRVFTIWPIRRGLAFKREHPEGGFPIGDLDEGLDVLLCSTTLSDAPVYWHPRYVSGKLPFSEFMMTLMSGGPWGDKLPDRTLYASSIRPKTI